jgi:hypothetical protein
VGKREVSRNDFQHFTGQCYLNGSNPPRGSSSEQALSGGLHQGGPGCLYRPQLSVCAVANVIGKPEGLTRIKESLT